MMNVAGALFHNKDRDRSAQTHAEETNAHVQGFGAPAFTDFASTNGMNPHKPPGRQPTRLVPTFNEQWIGGDPVPMHHVQPRSFFHPFEWQWCIDPFHVCHFKKAVSSREPRSHQSSEPDPPHGARERHDS